MDVAVLLGISTQRFRALCLKFRGEAPAPKRYGRLFLWSSADVAKFKKLSARVRPWGPYRKEVAHG
jgi:hypothetical protein